MFLTTTHIAIVMEYASGGELFEFVKRSGRLSEDAARFFFQQLISGVDYCHRQARRRPALQCRQHDRPGNVDSGVPFVSIPDGVDHRKWLPHVLG